MEHSQWQEQIEAFAQTNLSKTAYDKQHDLSYHKFLYYLAKSEKANVGTADFVPVSVKVASRSSECLGILEFPNGTRFITQDPNVFSYLPQLLDRYSEYVVTV